MSQFDEKSPYRVAVQRDFLMMGVAITFGIAYNAHSTVRIMHFNEEGIQSWTEHDPLMQIDKPTMRIQEEFARALYDQLGIYFSGQPDVTSSRADYLEERKAHARAEERNHELALKAIDAIADAATGCND